MSFYLILGRITGGLFSRSGRVKKQTPKIEKKKRYCKILTGRAKMRIKYNKRFSKKDFTTSYQLLEDN